MELNDEDKKLIDTANQLLAKVKGKMPIRKYSGAVAAALLATNGKTYTGIYLDFYCGEGVCAERNAIAEMAKDCETQIKKIVAVSETGVVPPCGVCREVIYQFNKLNLDTKVIVSNDKKVLLKELLPMNWQGSFEGLD